VEWTESVYLSELVDRNICITEWCFFFSLSSVWVMKYGNEFINLLPSHGLDSGKAGNELGLIGRDFFASVLTGPCPAIYPMLIELRM